MGQIKKKLLDTFYSNNKNSLGQKTISRYCPFKQILSYYAYIEFLSLGERKVGDAEDASS